MHHSYKEVKNNIHNELGIAKDEIREIIKEAVRNEVKVILENESYFGKYIEQLVKRGISDKGSLYYNFKERVAQKLSDEVGKYIKNQLNINIQVKNHNVEENVNAES
ncbi:hypothetical protein [Brevibacillus porteri]|uniref:hypothetical protein n=1 Tax=Brevibacillus porteri TaxID=2126350 RepID=UPI0036349D6E